MFFQLCPHSRHTLRLFSHRSLRVCRQLIADHFNLSIWYDLRSAGPMDRQVFPFSLIRSMKNLEPPNVVIDAGYKTSSIANWILRSKELPYSN